MRARAAPPPSGRLAKCHASLLPADTPPCARARLSPIRPSAYFMRLPAAAFAGQENIDTAGNARDGEQMVSNMYRLKYCLSACHQYHTERM